MTDLHPQQSDKPKSNQGLPSWVVVWGAIIGVIVILVAVQYI